jgi:hypothetical protein
VRLYERLIDGRGRGWEEEKRESGEQVFIQLSLYAFQPQGFILHALLDLLVCSLLLFI